MPESPSERPRMRSVPATSVGAPTRIRVRAPRPAGVLAVSAYLAAVFASAWASGIDGGILLYSPFVAMPLAVAAGALAPLWAAALTPFAGAGGVVAVTSSDSWSNDTVALGALIVVVTCEVLIGLGVAVRYWYAHR